MNEKQLSNRLKQVADFVPIAAVVADIGSDHAYLPCYLCLKDEQVTAIAGEVNEGPYQLAKAQVRRLGLDDKIDVRKGNGLEVLRTGEAEAVVIAGMGGGLITTILDEGIEKLAGVKRLILQPNVAADVIRRWLRANGWRLVEESILEEDQKIYEILVAEPGEDQDIYQEDPEQKLLLGPYLMQKKEPVFYKKWTHELNNWKQILAQLKEANKTEEMEQKKKEISKKMKMVGEVLL